MKNLFFIGLGLLTILTSCATILSGTKANVTVTTNSTEPVNLTVDGRTYYNIAGLTQVQVKRGYKVSKIVAENTNAYGSVDVYKEFNAVTLGNLILGGIPSFIIDVIDGAVTKPATDVFTIYMQSKNNQPKIEESTKEEPKEIVQNNDEIALENIIIRWDIQSRPQRADVFWRVVSKTQEVKSTNNKYLQTTPY